MIKALKSLIGLAGRTDASVAEIERGLPQAEAELVAAREAAADAERQYRQSLLSGDEARTRQLDAARREAQIRLDRATALIEALGDRHQEAEEAAAEERARAEKAQRVERYQAAARQAEEARGVLTDLYPQIAQDLVKIVLVVAEAEIAVQRANADLPDGAEPLQPVERTVRDPAGSGRRLISSTEVTRYCRPGELLPKLDQSRVVPKAGGGGYIQATDGTAEHLVARRFREDKFEEPFPTLPLVDLATAVKLPGLGRMDPDFIGLDAVTGPAEVVEILSKAVERGFHVPPVTRTELVPLDRVDAEAEFAALRKPFEEHQARGAGMLNGNAERPGKVA